MRRIFATHCPSVRSAPGNSFGPITISATMPIRINLPQPMSNIASPIQFRDKHGSQEPRVFVGGELVPAVSRLHPWRPAAPCTLDQNDQHPPTAEGCVSRPCDLP